ncbi:MAG: hypothetical protein KGL69_11790, partial [Alphaproteobacteria bacterium]|nr:hypothetical protein [Alphaproteobacteria bacterium]
MARRTGRAAALAILSLVGAGCASGALAAPADSPFPALTWRSIGPFRGGRVLAVTGVQDNPQHFLFGAVNGGVWETRDAGRTWTPIFDSAPVASIGALAVAPSDSKIIWVGTGEADMRSDIAQGQGLFRSTDGGRTWEARGLPDSQQIARILIDPRNPDVVLVAALGHPYGPNGERGVFRTTDGGAHWTRVLFKDADTGAIDLAFKPGDPNTVYAGLWQTRRPPWNVYPPSSGPGGGLYKSTDGGATWRRLEGHGLPDFTGRIGLAVSDAKPDRVYALIDGKAAAPGSGGLWRSDDSGATWAKVTGDPRIWNRGWYFGELTANPKDADQVWVCDTIVLMSRDGGKSFIPQKGDPTGDDFHQLWIDPQNPDRRILGVDQGALVTLNGGASWSSWFNQPTGQFYHVATDNRFPYRVYGAQQDSGAADVPSRTGSGWDGINMTQFHELTPGGESDSIAPDPDDPDLIYGGRVDRLDLKTGQVRDVDPTFAFPDAYHRTWTLPLIWGPDGETLYFGNQRIFATRDGGATWTPISPALDRPDDAAPATLDATTRMDTDTPGPRRGVVYAIGPSPRDPKDIWAGTDDGLVWRTRDGGAHWLDVTPKGLGDWSKIGAVEPSHFGSETAYLAVDRHRLDDAGPHILRTRDGGQTWTEIDDGLPHPSAGGSVNVVREDPREARLLFAGTERGAYVSFDAGDHWRPLQAGLPVTSVRDMTVHGDDLVIATHGRGFYVLDDIVVLRQMAADPSAAGEGDVLFAPAKAIRVRPQSFTGTPMPKDEPIAANPAFGAFIDYRLAADAKGPVTLTVTDAAGKVVRSWSSADPDPAPDLAKLDIAPEWYPRSPPPGASAGAHRFVWDLRYATPNGLPPGGGEGPGPGGVWAPPGRYTVTLNVDGRRFSRELTVAPDPRVVAPANAYTAEFDLARRIEADRLKAGVGLKALKTASDPARA